MENIEVTFDAIYNGEGKASSSKNTANQEEIEGSTDARYAAKPLSGLGLAVKDLFHIQGLPTAAGNPDWLATHPIPEKTNSCVAQILGAGATFKGKTITYELAYSLHGQNKHYGALVNPVAPYTTISKSRGVLSLI